MQLNLSMPSMKLEKILKQITNSFQIIANQNKIGEIEIEDIAIDSRLVKKNAIFFAVFGLENDGAKYAQSSVEKGSPVIVISKKSQFDLVNFNKNNPDIIVILCEEISPILEEFLKIFYHQLPKNIYAITGTNGKTSTVEFIRQILEFLKIKSASIGTVGVNCSSEIKDQLIAFNLTTPDIVSLYKNLNILKKFAIDDVAIEVSSIGLDQGRISGLNISCGGFTNFTQDHLDYHLSMEKYFEAKLKLFEKYLANNAKAVVNADVEGYQKISEICFNRHIEMIDYGKNAKKIKLTKIDEQEIFFDYDHKKFSFKMSANGDFQGYNLLCALSCVLSNHDLSYDDLTELLKKFPEIQVAQGRMQKILQLKNDAEIFIDFAHSPDAIENVLKQARIMVEKKNFRNNRNGKLIILFGCGGDRDKKKRPIMGRIASELADKVVISDDNPRSENPYEIRQEILNGCIEKNILEIADRKIAIVETVKSLSDNDILILAGKGHEKYQIIGDQKFDFDEEKIVKNAIK